MLNAASSNNVIGETTSHSTKPASGKVAGYPAKAGIQQEHTSRVADKDGMSFRFADDFQSTGFPLSRE